MSTWTRLRSRLVREAHLVASTAPAVLAAARAFQEVHRAREQTLHLGRTRLTIVHDDRRAYVAAAMVAGVVVGVATGLLFAPRPGPETRARVRERAFGPWPALDRLPEALRAARTAAAQAFQREEPPQPSI